MERVELNFVGCWLAYGRRYALVTLLEDPLTPQFSGEMATPVSLLVIPGVSNGFSTVPRFKKSVCKQKSKPFVKLRKLVKTFYRAFNDSCVALNVPGVSNGCATVPRR